MRARTPGSQLRRAGTASRAALDAAAAQFAATVALLTVPVLLLAGLLSSVGSTAADVAPMIAGAVALPLSLLAHELAHAAVAAALLDIEGVAHLRGSGSIRSSTIYRPGLARAESALVAIAGPAAGIALSLPVVLAASTSGSSLLLTAPWMLPFLAHVPALSPRRSDGEQLAEYLRSLVSGR